MDSFVRNELHYVILDKPESEHEKEIVKLVDGGVDPNKQDNKAGRL